jgi:hypothetical protein
MSHPRRIFQNMDTYPHDATTRPADGPSAGPAGGPPLRPTGTDHAAERSPQAGPELVQQPLPFDDEADQPVAFSLTARARREIAPEDLPALSVVRDARRLPATDRTPRDGTGGDVWPVRDDPSDTRPSRARALRRAGLPAAEIARQLRVEPLLVRAWIGATNDPTVGHATDRAPTVDVDPEEEQRETAFQLARATAAEQARRDLRRDPGFAAGLGLVASIVDIDRNALTVTTGDQEVARMSLRWLDEHLPLDPARVRLVLRLGPRAAGDLVAHRWASRLGIDRQRVAVARWHDAPDGQSVQALLRVADPGAAATVAGWRDALLAPSGSDPADIAF